jgi:catechol 2,3-dioxygenase-like lactoylglutathione lyase family enzyme
VPARCRAPDATRPRRADGCPTHARHSSAPEVEDIDGALAELRAKGVKLRDEAPRIGHGGARIAFIDPSSTGNVLIELAELPQGHGAHA